MGAREKPEYIRELERGVASLLAQWESSDLLASEGARAIVRWVLANDRLMDALREHGHLSRKIGTPKADLVYLKDTVLR